MRGRWHYPLDPECPEVQNFYEGADDPIMRMSGCWGEFLEDFERKHIRDCKRCQEFGAAVEILCFASIKSNIIRYRN